MGGSRALRHFPRPGLDDFYHSNVEGVEGRMVTAWNCQSFWSWTANLLSSLIKLLESSRSIWKPTTIFGASNDLAFFFANNIEGLDMMKLYTGKCSSIYKWIYLAIYLYILYFLLYIKIFLIPFHSIPFYISLSLYLSIYIYYIYIDKQINTSHHSDRGCIPTTMRPVEPVEPALHDLLELPCPRWTWCRWVECPGKSTAAGAYEVDMWRYVAIHMAFVSDRDNTCIQPHNLMINSCY